jgi:hypothetical protein
MPFLSDLNVRFPNPLGYPDCVDYQVVRLYEDLLDILPAVFSPVPDEVHETVSTASGFQNWLLTNNAISNKVETDQDWDDFFDFRSWTCERFLSTMHLTQRPIILFWQYRNRIHIRWDNTSCVVNGLQPWTSIQGHHEMPVTEFMQEIESFHQRLMDLMQERVHILQTRNPLSAQIHIDIEQITQEHAERTKSLELALAKKPEAVDWERVAQVNARFLVQ